MSIVAELEQDRHAQALLPRVFGVDDAPAEEVDALVARAIACGARARVEARLQSAIDAQAAGGREPSPALLTHLADLHDQRGRYAEAEELYRRILHLDPGNVVALTGKLRVVMSLQPYVTMSLARPGATHRAQSGGGRRWC